MNDTLHDHGGITATNPRLLPDSTVADLVFLDAWERDPAPGPAALRRVMQIRRANPELAAAIRERYARH